MMWNSLPQSVVSCPTLDSFNVVVFFFFFFFFFFVGVGIWCVCVGGGGVGGEGAGGGGAEHQTTFYFLFFFSRYLYAECSCTTCASTRIRLPEVSVLYRKKKKKRKLYYMSRKYDAANGRSHYNLRHADVYQQPYYMQCKDQTFWFYLLVKRTQRRMMLRGLCFMLNKVICIVFYVLCWIKLFVLYSIYPVIGR